VVGMGVAAGRYKEMPVWLKGLVISLFAGGYIYFGILPLFTNNSPPGLQAVMKLFGGRDKETSRSDPPE